MGLFNVVVIDKKCPNCGAEVEWQSKDIIDNLGYSIEPYMERVKVEDIQIGEMHTLCHKCNRWFEYKIKNGEIALIGKEKIKKSRRDRKLTEAIKKIILKD